MTTVASTPNQPAAICQRFDVIGMTCSHCERAVAAEVGALPGVLAATADAAAGTLTVESAHEIGHEAIAAAVAEAGYELAR